MKTIKISRYAKSAECPRCGWESFRHSRKNRVLKDINGIVHLTFSMHLCTRCKRAFVNPAVKNLCGGTKAYTCAFRNEAVRLLIEENLHLADAYIVVLKRLGHSLAPSTLHDWAVKFSDYVKRDRRSSDALGKIHL